MKIVHTATGKVYQLTPGTQLEVERPNLFFNDYGEQTLPVDLPDTDTNRALTGYPDMPANRKKPQADILCSILDGDYCMNARQAILGAKRKEKITTTFYMNEGSFLSRIHNTTVASVFGDETVPGIETVQQGIEWCWSLRDNHDEHFAIFPTIIDLDGEKRGVNIVSLMDKDGNPRTERYTSGTLPDGYAYGFFHSFNRKESVEGQVVTLSPGYYITPFIRANYLLERIFSYFGYTLQENFFTRTEPFQSMVFVNNTADTLVNGTILLSHLVPDCLCSTILELFRKKFCCEFVPDETARTVRIELFKEIINSRSQTDLTPCLTGYPEISFQEARQLKLSSKNSLTEGSTFDGTGDIKRKYPSVFYDADSGEYKRHGYGAIRNGVVTEILSDGNLPYYAGEEDMEEYEVSVPDCQFCVSSVAYYKNSGSGVSEVKMTAPYIGEGRMLNSTIEGLGGYEEDEESGTADPSMTSGSHEQDPVLAFLKYGDYFYSGTNHDTGHGYSLLYNGPIGIFEMFYRNFDNLLRNALHKVTAPLLLTDRIKQSLPVHGKVCLKNADYLVDVLKYTIGGKNEPMETTLLSTQLLEPTSAALPENERIPTPIYRWIAHLSKSTLTEAEWIAAGYEKGAIVSCPILYPPMPTESQYNAGGKYHERTLYHSSAGSGDNEVRYYRSELYLTPALF